MIGVVVVVAVVMVFTVSSPLGRAVMFAILLTALVRATVLFRSLRREARE
jgi:Na+/H+ antiporter NhaD/arsenite permease-like protein